MAEESSGGNVYIGAAELATMMLRGERIYESPQTGAAEQRSGMVFCTSPVLRGKTLTNESW